MGRYELLELLGEGGMGRVYVGLDTVLGRRVAVKVLRDDLGLPPDTRAHLTDRLKVEARAVAAVSHPNVVTLHDMGEDPTAGLFLVFELVAGETLRARLARGPLAPDDVARLAQELGDALDAAHAAGVLHRDVKPENVLLSQTGSKIGDFGLARVPEGGLTREGDVLGTPAYSAPETLAGGPPHAQGDVFAMAATLYEALTGTRAFPGKDLLTVAAAIAVGGHTPRAIVRDDLEPDTARELTRVLVERGLAKDPADRFASPAELGRAVARALRARLRSDGATAPEEERPARRLEGASGRPPRWLNYLVGIGLLAGLAGIVIERRSHLQRSEDAGAPHPRRTPPGAHAPATHAPSAPHASAKSRDAGPAGAHDATPATREGE